MGTFATLPLNIAFDQLIAEGGTFCSLRSLIKWFGMALQQTTGIAIVIGDHQRVSTRSSVILADSDASGNHILFYWKNHSFCQNVAIV